MKFRERYGWGRTTPPISAREVVKHTIDTCFDAYSDGQLEELLRKVEKLSEVVAMIVDHLPSESQAAIATELGYDEVQS